MEVKEYEPSEEIRILEYLEDELEIHCGYPKTPEYMEAKMYLNGKIIKLMKEL